MNKKLLITILTILGLTVIVGSFWYFSKLQKTKLQKTNTKLTQNNTAKNISNNQNQEQEKNQKQKNDNQNKQINTKQLSLKEIEKLKKEKNLVWYEIPELNIKFLVTEDTKKDLKYSYKEFRGYRYNNDYLKVKSIMLYNSSETDKNLSNCILDEDKGWSCGWIQLNAVLRKELTLYKKRNNLSNVWCNNNSFKKFEIDNYFGCIIRTRGYVILNDEYQNFFHIPINQSNKIFGIYFNAIQPIK